VASYIRRRRHLPVRLWPDEEWDSVKGSYLCSLICFLFFKKIFFWRFNKWNIFFFKTSRIHLGPSSISVFHPFSERFHITSCLCLKIHWIFQITHRNKQFRMMLILQESQASKTTTIFCNSFNINLSK
jgi:hypothetical protein